MKCFVVYKHTEGKGTEPFTVFATGDYQALAHVCPDKRPRFSRSIPAASTWIANACDSGGGMEYFYEDVLLHVFPLRGHR